MSDGLEALPCRIGQIFVTREESGRIALCHRDDVGRTGLTESDQSDMAAEIARYDDSGAYRPLKTAPNLRHGWSLRLEDLAAVCLALDLFYPGRLAAFAAWKCDRLATTPLRETLARQTGMYRVAAKIGDAEADALVSGFCRSEGSCLRTILWHRDATGAPASTKLPQTKFDPGFDQTGRNEPTLPLLCQESCNLLVAAARKMVKGEEE